MSSYDDRTRMSMDDPEGWGLSQLPTSLYLDPILAKVKRISLLSVNVRTEMEKYTNLDAEIREHKVNDPKRPELAFGPLTPEQSKIIAAKSRVCLTSVSSRDMWLIRSMDRTRKLCQQPQASGRCVVYTKASTKTGKKTSGARW